jgi:uncharacterized protein YndB with AHSA1/START domain
MGGCDESMPGRQRVTTIVNSVTIDGPIEAIFDLATTARFWPDWHPATRAVGGVTERPYRLGDVVHERGEAAGASFQVAWTVVEHERPWRMMMRTGPTPPARITYTFEPRGGSVEFRRELEYDATAFRSVSIGPEALRAALHEQSEEAVRRLKGRVEAILRAEAEPLA